MFAGFQIATNQISEGVAAAKMAAENGASWLDLNCGCPIHGEYARVPAAGSGQMQSSARYEMQGPIHGKHGSVL